jgi:hypothetical protein
MCWENTTTHQKRHGLRTFYVHTPRACVRARLCERAWLSIRLSVDGFSSNVLGTYFKSPQVAWATYFSCPHTAHMRASARVRARVCERACASARVVKHSLIFGRILFKLAGSILQITTSSVAYVLFYIHASRARVRARVCERACASAHVVKRSLIFGRILFKFVGHVLQITASSMGYVLFMFIHCAHAYERARASSRVGKRSHIFGKK